MPLHDIAFYFALFFLAGVAAASFGISLIILIAIVAISGVVLLRLNKSAVIVFLAPSVILGFVYFNIYEDFKGEGKIVFDEEIEFEGVIFREPAHNIKSQKITAYLSPPYNGDVVIYASPYPQYQYGDKLSFKGVISKSPSGALNISSFPEIKLLEKGSGTGIKRFLFSFKRKVLENLEQSLSPEPTALIAGEVLGDRSGFSKEFVEAMSKSGTTHIVAISGYNISILVFAVMFSACYFVKRKAAFYISVIFIVLFTLMTGAEASVVRAAIMGIIILSASQFERIYSFRNALTLAAFFMVLFDPNILVFDTGFQLSFGALLGIVYLLPALKSLFGLTEEGFLSWKSNALTTLSAQGAVLPILFYNFGYFSFTSIVANVLILEVIPITMALGFLVGFAGFVSLNLSTVLGWFLNIFMQYQILIINLFSKLTLPVYFNNFPVLLAVIYYLFLVWFIHRMNIRHAK